MSLWLHRFRVLCRSRINRPVKPDVRKGQQQRTRLLVPYTQLGTVDFVNRMLLRVRRYFLNDFRRRVYSNWHRSFPPYFFDIRFVARSTYKDKGSHYLLFVPDMWCAISLHCKSKYVNVLFWYCSCICLIVHRYFLRNVIYSITDRIRSTATKAYLSLAQLYIVGIPIVILNYCFLFCLI